MFLYEHYSFLDFISIIKKNQELFGAAKKMIKYDRLSQTMKKKKISQYDLYTRHNVNRSQINRLKNNKNVEKSYIDFFNIGQTIVVLKEK